MPKLINTQTRIADLGKPRVIIVGGGFGGLEVVKKLIGKKVQTVLFDKYNQHCFQPLLYRGATSALKTRSMAMVGRNKFFVLINWMWSYFSYDKSNRIIIARPKDGVH